MVEVGLLYLRRRSLETDGRKPAVVFSSNQLFDKRGEAFI
jgi:hypothetical protein